MLKLFLKNLLDTASKLALFLVSGLKDAKLIKNQICMKSETLFYCLLNISAKYHLNRSL